LKNAKGEVERPQGEPLYRKGETAAIHHLIVAKLKAKGADMEISNYDKEAAVKRRQKAMKETQKLAYAD
jgi:hypothetical protein